MNTKHEYRLYTFSHMWLSAIQKGVQSTHGAVELMLHSGSKQDVKDWAKYDKTAIFLNGGPSIKLQNILKALKGQKVFSFASFCEDEQSLEGAMTAVVAVFPKDFYNLFHLGREINSLSSKSKSAVGVDLETLKEREKMLKDAIVDGWKTASRKEQFAMFNLVLEVCNLQLAN